MPPPDDRRRSCLSVPGSSPKMIAKATEIVADEVVFDLEDAVAPAAKEEARALVLEALARPQWKGRTTAVRVNAPGTPWCHLDLLAFAAHAEHPLSIVLPKVECAGDIEFVERLLAGAESSGRQPLRVQALVETAVGLERVGEIAAAAPRRLAALILGYADLGASLGRDAGAGDDPGAWLPAQERVLTAARAQGLQAIDGPYLGTTPDEGFRRWSGRVAELGFDGKWAIHPSQVEPLNAIFMPTEDRVAWARRVIAALGGAEDGAGAVVLDGQMIDEAVRLAADRVLLRAGADR
jgi:citrate lyase subunit beta/citryl-CoA lyase